MQTQRERGLLPNMKQNPAEDEHVKSLWTGSNMALVRPYWRIDVDMYRDGTHIVTTIPFLVLNKLRIQ